MPIRRLSWPRQQLTRVRLSELPVTYKAQLDQVNIRRNQIAAQLKPLYDKFEADQKAAAKPAAGGARGAGCPDPAA